MRTRRAATRTGIAAAALGIVLASCGDVVTLSERELELRLRPDVAASTVVDATGDRLAELRREYRRRVRLDDVPQVLVDAVLAAEDARFLEHGGVDARALTRAALRNAVAGEVVEGGSTITQQLVELRFMPPTEDTLSTKATEAALALEVEQQFPKEWILEEYLNTVYLGGGAHGVGAAAWSYFRADVADLGLPEAALLAGLIRTPGTADPRVSVTAAADRRQTVLGRMVDVGAITPAQATVAAATPIVVHDAPARPRRTEPHVVDLAVRQLLDEPSLGDDEAERWRRLTGGGLTIHTTVDPAAQQSARDALAAALDEPGDPDGAVVTLDTATGRIVALVGSVPYDLLQFDLAFDGRRQPGSVVKGFTTVAALVAGVRPDDMLDARGGTMPVGGPDDDPWVVRSSGRTSRSFDEALRWSDNGVFARLGLDLGIETVAATARGLGVGSDLGGQPAMLLGGTGQCCTPVEIAAAYATIGSLGTHHEPTVVSHVTDADGQVVWRAPTVGRQAVDEVIAWEAATMLTGVVDAGTGRAAAVPGHVVAGKTGTTTDNTDGWFVGTTPSLTTAVWIGHYDARRTARVDGVPIVGGGPPARVFREHMRRVLDDPPGPPFQLPPERTVSLLVDVETGLRDGPWCGETEERVFPDTRVPTSSCPSPPPPPPPPPPTPTPTPTPTSTSTSTPSEPTTPRPTATSTPSPTPSPTATSTPAPPPTPPPPTPTPTPTPTPPAPTADPSPRGPDPTPPPPAATPPTAPAP